MGNKNKIEIWDLFKKKDFYMRQLEECRKDIQNLDFATSEEELSILHGYCNIMSAYILEIYALNHQIKEIQDANRTKLN